MKEAPMAGSGEARSSEGSNGADGQGEAWKTAFGDAYLDLYATEFSESLDRTQVGDILELLDLGAGAKLLDAGCGQGRHLRHFLECGLDATGLDFSADMLAAARQGGLPEMRLVQGDIRCPPFPEGHFDAVTSLFTAFGFFDDPAEDLTALTAFRRSLRPGGWLILETIHAGAAARSWPADKAYPLGPSITVRERNRLDWELDWETGTLDQVVTVEGADAPPRVFATRLRIYSGQRLTQLLDAAGFVDVACMEGLRTDPDAAPSFGPLRPDSSRIACIGRRPAHADA
jgi:SAM-dependent methyltransferase